MKSSDSTSKTKSQVLNETFSDVKWQKKEDGLIMTFEEGAPSKEEMKKILDEMFKAWKR